MRVTETPCNHATPSYRELQLQPGHTRLLGATLEPSHINFALVAPHAQAVELCLFDAQGQQELVRLGMHGPRDGLWHGSLARSANIGAGLVYGWRVHGPWAPQQGHRFNPAKLLLDPYAREVLGQYLGEDIHLGHVPSAAPDSGAPDPRDNARLALKARVVADLPPGAVVRPHVDPARRVIYELHIKGFTALHPGVPSALRGSYAGLAHPAALAHLQALGVTTLCLMPVAQRADEPRLLALGLRNYWGYNPVAWSAPESRYWSGTPGSSPRTEFRGLVDALHAAGLEVVLDVVYNHTAESDEFGPTLSLRGIDNALYYHLLQDDRSRYANWTGCGNSVHLNDPLVLRTAMDSLRLWVSEFDVDGFRFDLAPVLGRGCRSGDDSFQPQAPLLAAIAQDPLLRDRLMIAEPWDIGPGGYQLGRFPPGWLEWNDRFRDVQRDFWLQRRGSRGAMAQRLAGSSVEFDSGGRGPHSSVNFVTAHDGFTLHDLVSYAQRHNLANGEHNRDGHGHNLSINNGIEGATDNAAVLLARRRQRQALLSALLLSLGTPMLLSGDELGHTQGGNNNAYCQDNDTTWLRWDAADADLCGFVARVIALRHALPLLQSRGWWQSEPHGCDPAALWYTPQGQRMQASDWEDGQGLAWALVLHQPQSNDALLLLLNGHAHPMAFNVPAGAWCLRLDSESGWAGTASGVLAPQTSVPGTCLQLATLAAAAPAGA